MTALYTIRPLENRTGFGGKPKRGPFEAPYSDTRALLARELRMLNAKNVILEIDVLPGQIRLDGELYASAQARTPAVRLHFDSIHGHITYETDAFNHWQHNVRAIALGLESLRRVDRYKLGRGGEQYRGYLALEAGATALGSAAEMPWTNDHARQVLLDVARIEFVVRDDVDTKSLIRKARKVAHPDARGGDQGMWDDVVRATSTLGYV